MLTTELIDRMFELRDQKREIENALKPITQELEELRSQIVQRLQEEQSEGIRTSKATATLTEQTICNVVDWDVFHQYVKDNEAFYLLQRRVTNAAWLELFKAGETIPGTAPFTKYDINLRKR